NPFNPETTISFRLPLAGFVKMQVYNARGQLIQTLIESDLPAGSHQQNWRAETAGGVSMASGLYFVRITAGDFTATRKMLLLR
ncbi:T9SS type A sorting domain-containing protein, partial [bacterium]|nr:T9SS type A sorting domain-containing protein [bacterium]